MLIRAAIAAAALACAADSFGQSGIVAPRPLSQPMPETPENRFGFPTEGWVEVVYTVDAQGAVQDVEIIDRVPYNVLPGPAIEAVEQWRFTPASADGDMIDWHRNESVVVYDSAEVPFEATPLFLRSFTEVQALIDAGDLERAQKDNQELLDTMIGSLRDAGHAYTQAAFIALRLGDFHAAHDAIRRSTSEHVRTLDDSELVAALSYRFVAEVNLGRVNEALHTFERLRDVMGEVSGAIAEQVEAIAAALTPDVALVIKGRIDHEPWRHSPSRRIFTLADIDGSVGDIEVACDRRRVTLEYEPDVDWTLPASWGACTLAIDGRRNTSFVLYEFAE